MSRAFQDQLSDVLRGPPGRAHLMGVCGVGVAGVAFLLKARGWRVDGCDASPDGALARWLVERGVAVSSGHDVAHIMGSGNTGPALLIHTAAAPSDHPEIVAARTAGMTVCRRGEALAALVGLRRGVAVCGAHGKTTTTCFTTRLLQELHAEPDWCIGGTTPTLGGVAGVGKGGLLVVEADESDGTLAQYHPAVTVLLNIDLDHLEHFDGEEALVDCYRQAVAQTREGVAFCVDDARARQVAESSGVRHLGFGFDAAAELRAHVLALEKASSTSEIFLRGENLGSVTLSVPGRHNILNALAALAAVQMLGFDLRAALAALPRAASELPGRRFEQVASSGGVWVIADYAHHPAEIRALVAAARLQDAQRIVAIFQPHRYTRTKALGVDFPGAFDGVDEVVLAPVYAASEPPMEEGGIADLYGRFRELRPDRPARLARSLEEAWEGVRRMLRTGDLLLIVGAGDVVKIANWAVRDLESGAWGEATPLSARAGAAASVAAELSRVEGLTVTPGRELADVLFYGVGGRADVFAEATTPEALRALLAWTASHDVACHILGAGANTWASDLGVAGVVARMRGAAWRDFVRRDAEVEVGCGWHGPALLDRLESEGLSGLEFLEGVPGQVGGWLAMNAGAHGGELSAHVATITCLNADGSESIVDANNAGFGYRHCAALEIRIACRVVLRLAKDAPEAIRARRAAIRAKRLPLVGLRTAGSVFCNPPGDFAGRLLDAAGCKKLRIGGASVYERHANVVVASDGATASDVLALLAIMRRRVWARFGVQLKLENRMLGMTANAGHDGLTAD